MSNQRSGKYHKAALSDGSSDMRLYNFFKDCKELLEESNDDASGYFETLMDELSAGRSLPSSRRDISRLLGI